ncbi:MAG TPA: hypothetical protein DHV01_14475 [Rhodoferax sp.]|nr:MAG: hypothetical protein A2037_08815 [Curvibacter sp. GWA2_63_95]HCX82789.1 hypothetical protein [Rhodoferax sp.]
MLMLSDNNRFGPVACVAQRLLSGGGFTTTLGQWIRTKLDSVGNKRFVITFVLVEPFTNTTYQ